ncbi:MAG: glycoside hydrolase family 32 protein, partial [Candidatus Methylomirabilota bacterium]
ELDDQPGWFAHLDVSEWKGRSATLHIENIPENSKALDLVSVSDEVWNADKLYSEPLRPQLQFSTRCGWVNDPNGLVFYNGEYHLFFQHTPYCWAGGNAHWGHAISRDLVHWQELGEAIYPDNLGGPWSGSAVVDWKNTSGFGKDGKPPLVLFYTYVGDPATQCIAYSTDGRTFTKFAGNPVVKNISNLNRDPKVFWHEPTQKWVMVLYVGLPNADKPNATGLMPNHTLQFFTSPNLRDWTFASVTKGGGGYDFFLYECPDFFELPVDGDALNKKWVLSAGNSEYAVGTFDGTKFIPEEVRIPGQTRRGCFYAPQTFNDTPDGRRIQIGWGQAPAPGMPFNQLQTFPCELTLRSTSAGPRLRWQPVKELETLRGKSWNAGKPSLAEGDANPLADVRGELLEVRADFTPAADSEVVFNVRGVEIRYNAAKQEISGTDVRAPAPRQNGRQRITIFADRNYFTVFAGDGLTYMPFPVIPKSDNLSVEVKVKGGAIAVHQLEAFALKSIWEK